jgi:hypothetical protein
VRKKSKEIPSFALYQEQPKVMPSILKSIFLLLLSGFFYLPSQAQYYGVRQTIVGQWAAGIQVGNHYLLGDVPQLFPAMQGGIYLQNSFSQALDLKVMVEGGLSTGQGTDPSHGFFFNSALNGEANPDFAYDTLQQVFYNYQLRHGVLSGVLKLNLNRLIRPDLDTWDLYLLGGLGFLMYETKTDAFKEGEGAIYDYSQITGTDPVQIRQQITELRDGTYETYTQQDLLNSTRLGNRILRVNAIGGMGFRVRLAEKIGLGLEARYHLIADDLLDGQQWTEDNVVSEDNDHLITGGITLDYIF